MRPLQEKFQVIVPGKIEGDEPWATFESQRNTHGEPEWRPATSEDTDPRKFNYMPENMDTCTDTHMPLSMAGESDQSKDTNPQSFARGFRKNKMNGSDDQYTGEHVDHFYDDAGGFAERNNYLDRL